MRKIIRRQASLLGDLTPATFSWPGMDVSLASGRQFHLVGSIHMGTSAMVPLPTRLLERLKQAQAAYSRGGHHRQPAANKRRRGANPAGEST